MRGKLYEIQQKLEVPKSQYNSFGKYKYRSCEDILAAVKLLLPAGTTISLTDEMVNIGERNYIKATVILADETESLQACGYAREAEEQKGMDKAQITGTASSYARKYALNGLFAIDDIKDTDTDEHKKEAEGKLAKKEVKPKAEPTPEQKLKAATDFTDAYMKKLLDVKDQRDLDNLNYSMIEGKKSTYGFMVKLLQTNQPDLYQIIDRKTTEITKQWLEG